MSLGPLDEYPYNPGTRIPHGAHVEFMNRAGDHMSLDVDSKLFAPIAATPRGPTAPGRVVRSPSGSPSTSPIPQ